MLNHVSVNTHLPGILASLFQGQQYPWPQALNHDLADLVFW